MTGRRRRGRSARWAGGAGLLLLLLVLAAVGWVGVRGVLAVRHLGAAAAAVPAVRAAASAGDLTTARTDLDRFSTQTAAAHRLTGDPVWAAATHLPRVGADLGALRTVAAVADDLGSGVVQPLAGPQVLGALSAARAEHDGTAPLVRALAGAEPSLNSAQLRLQAATARLEDLGSAGLDPAVAGPVAQLRDRMAAAAVPLDTAVRAARVVPGMLDDPRPRTYLVLFQNLAEARSLGGIPGAFAVVRAEHGTLRMVGQGSSSDVGPFSSPVVDLPAGYASLTADRPARYLQDVTAAPWFPDAARSARAMWQRTSGQQVDGVVATDPVLLADLLAVTGPIRTPDGRTVTAHQISALVQSDVYRMFPQPAAQDRFFAGTAAAAFATLTRYRGDPLALLRAAAAGVAQGRLLVWDARPPVEAGLTGTVLAGVPGGNAAPDAQRPLVAVYLNDATGSKMSWYLHRRATVDEGPRATGGGRRLTVRLVLSSSAPRSGLPPYVTGNGDYGVPPGTMRVTVWVVGSGAGSVVGARVDGRPVASGSVRLHGRPVCSLGVDLAPGGRRVVQVDLVAPPGQGSPRLVLQPMAQPG